MAAAAKAKATSVEDLPEDHIFRLIHRNYDTGDRSDLNRPVDIEAIIHRLGTPGGREEARQWVETPVFTRLFIHQLCDSCFDFDGSGKSPGLVDVESGRGAVRLAIEAYPDSTRQTDSAGHLPLHNICDRNVVLMRGPCPPRTGGVWTRGIKGIFDFLIEKYPDGASVIADDGRSALDMVLDYNSTPNIPVAAEDRGNVLIAKQERDEVALTLIDLFPAAAAIPGRGGLYPVHWVVKKFPVTATHRAILIREEPSYIPNLWPLPSLAARAVKESIIKKLIGAYPQALEKSIDHSQEGLTPLLKFLQSYHGGLEPEAARIVEMMLRACPSSAWIQDSAEVGLSDDNIPPDFYPAGDALDYLSTIYCGSLNNFGPDHFLVKEDDVYIAVGGFVEASKECLGHSADEEFYCDDCDASDCERMFQMILTIGGLPHGTVAPFRPLHAFCSGSRCRPWYMVIIDQIIQRYPNQARERDHLDNLPLHLFLHSCMLEKERAKRIGFVYDDEEYFQAVRFCFVCILGANPDAAKKANGEGLLPIHLAVQYCNKLDFRDILQPLLDRAPDSLFVKDPETQLYPFAQASVGPESNADTAFLLLRRNPSVMEQFAGDARPETVCGQKRKVAEPVDPRDRRK